MPKLHIPHAGILVALTSTSSALIGLLSLSLPAIVDCWPAHWMNSETELSPTRQALYAGLVVSGPQMTTGLNAQSQPGGLGPLGTVGPLDGAAGPLEPGSYAEQRFRARRKEMVVGRTKIEEGMVAGG